MRKLALLFFLGAAGLGPGLAAAANSPLGPNAPREAVKRYNIARHLYGQGRFAEAAAEFDVAQAMMPRSSKLAFNAARCYERAGDLAKAVDRYEHYLRLSPDALDRDEVETMLEALRCRLQENLPELAISSPPPGPTSTSRRTRRPGVKPPSRFAGPRGPTWCAWSCAATRSPSPRSRW